MLGPVTSSSTGPSPNSDHNVNADDMTVDDAADANGTSSPASVLAALVDTDTAADQAAHRLANLAARDRLAVATQAVADWEALRADVRAGVDQAADAVAAAEADGDRCDAERRDLEAKLRTVIAPREAEALQNEIAQVAARRSAADEAGLVALEQHTQLSEALAQLVGREDDLRAECRAADEDLRRAETDITTEIAMLEHRRRELRDHLGPDLLGRYDRLRTQLGVAAAHLVGARCEGCHLDMSQAELDVVRRAPADDFPDCPQCGRLLIR